MTKRPSHYTHSHFNRTIAIFALSLLIFCSCQKKEDLFADLSSISVNDSEVIDHTDLNRQLLEAMQNTKRTDNPLPVLYGLFFEPHAKNSLITIHKVTDDHLDKYKVTLIFDTIPDDDSVRGYRYDLKLKKNAEGLWEITEARKSWRCWPDRGHRFFSAEPCL